MDTQELNESSSAQPIARALPKIPSSDVNCDEVASLPAKHRPTKLDAQPANVVLKVLDQINELNSSSEIDRLRDELHGLGLIEVLSAAQVRNIEMEVSLLVDRERALSTAQVQSTVAPAEQTKVTSPGGRVSRFLQGLAGLFVAPAVKQEMRQPTAVKVREDNQELVAVRESLAQERSRLSQYLVSDGCVLRITCSGLRLLEQLRVRADSLTGRSFGEVREEILLINEMLDQRKAFFIMALTDLRLSTEEAEPIGLAELATEVVGNLSDQLDRTRRAKQILGGVVGVAKQYREVPFRTMARVSSALLRIEVDAARQISEMMIVADILGEEGIGNIASRIEIAAQLMRIKAAIPAKARVNRFLATGLELLDRDLTESSVEELRLVSILTVAGGAQGGLLEKFQQKAMALRLNPECIWETSCAAAILADASTKTEKKWRERVLPELAEYPWSRGAKDAALAAVVALLPGDPAGHLDLLDSIRSTLVRIKVPEVDATKASLAILIGCYLELLESKQPPSFLLGGDFDAVLGGLKGQHDSGA